MNIFVVISSVNKILLHLFLVLDYKNNMIRLQLSILLLRWLSGRSWKVIFRKRKVLTLFCQFSAEDRSHKKLDGDLKIIIILLL